MKSTEWSRASVQVVQRADQS